MRYFTCDPTLSEPERPPGFVPSPEEPSPLEPPVPIDDPPREVPDEGLPPPDDAPPPISDPAGEAWRPGDGRPSTSA